MTRPGVEPPAIELTTLVVRVLPRHAAEVSEVLLTAGAEGLWEQRRGRAVELRAYAPDAAAAARWHEAVLRECATRAIVIDAALEPGDTAWKSAWVEALGPQLLTPTSIIKPVADPSPDPAGARVIYFEPELAFGDGAHATTRLAAASVERFCNEQPGCSVLDYGTGSGVLALLAALTGAGRVLGVDIDPVAVAAARHNAELNQLRERVEFAAVEALAGAPDFQLVVANLPPRTLLELCAPLSALAQRSQRLILTGFLVEQAEAVRAAFVELGFALGAESEEAGWSLLELRPLRR